jgi:hypothetical protein
MTIPRQTNLKRNRDFVRAAISDLEYRKSQLEAELVELRQWIPEMPAEGCAGRSGNGDGNGATSPMPRSETETAHWSRIRNDISKILMGSPKVFEQSMPNERRGLRGTRPKSG